MAERAVGLDDSGHGLQFWLGASADAGLLGELAGAFQTRARPTSLEVIRHSRAGAAWMARAQPNATRSPRCS